MFVSLRYNGTYKRRITWNSMGECFSYVVRPGEIIEVPATQVKNAQGTAPLTLVKKKSKKGVKVIRKIFEREASEVVTEEDKEVFKKQDKLDPFAGYEGDGREVEIEIEDDEPEEELLQEEEEAAEEEVEEPEDAEEEVAEEVAKEVVEEEDVEKKPDTDFAALNKKQLVAWLLNNGNGGKEYKLMKEKRDTLIKMCVDLEASL